ncbi:MAG: endonuclease domain-containing protein, partial [Pseudomonadota bacterium]|nr:endonuclease domain-containing protein [Pseudomonadota bacterium]
MRLHRLCKQGFRVLRFWNTDVLSNIECVYTIIEAELKKPLPPARPTSPWGNRASAQAHPHPNP